MLPILLILQGEIPETLVEKSLEADPYNGIAYGLLIAILLSFSIYNIISNSKADKEKREFSKALLEQIGKFELALATGEIKDEARDKRLDDLEEYSKETRRRVERFEKDGANQ